MDRNEQDKEQEERYHVLVEFAHSHLDFQLAELESTLELFGIRLNTSDCRMVPLPDGLSASGEPERQQYGDKSKSEVFDRAMNVSEVSAAAIRKRSQRSFVILSFPANSERIRHRRKPADPSNQITSNNNDNQIEHVRGIGEMLSRCTLVRSVVELWGASTTMESCGEKVRQFVTATTVGKEIFQKVASPSQSWKVTVHTVGTKYGREEQESMRQHFSTIGFQGKVQMKNPNHEYIVIREIELNRLGCPLFPRYSEKKELIPDNDARPPLAVYFGRILNGNRNNRDGLDKYNLKKRTYLGPTSMDAELSFIMASLGLVQHGSIVFDPFAGTGSILLSCALRGAYCVGSDIDIRVLYGKGKEKTIYSNFDQFNLQRPELLRTDNAIYHRHFRHHKPIYDAIICDPPYGIRAGARKTGSRKENPRVIPDEHRHDHIAQTKPYVVSDVMADLLDVAARTLTLNGRLVYVIPSFQEFNPVTDLPRHECLELAHSCYQPLSPELGRRIVAMKKVAEYDPSKRDEYLSSVWVNGKESAEKCANIREKIMEAAKLKPGYEEKMVVRRQKRKAHKEAKKKTARSRLDSQDDEVVAKDA